MAAALTLEGVGKRYGTFEAVRDLSFQVEKGSICGFLGPNGAGKTSTPVSYTHLRAHET